MDNKPDRELGYWKPGVPLKPLRAPIGVSKAGKFYPLPLSWSFVNSNLAETVYLKMYAFTNHHKVHQSL